MSTQENILSIHWSSQKSMMTVFHIVFGNNTYCICFSRILASVTQTPRDGSTFKPLNFAWDKSGSKVSNIRVALPQIRVETLIGSQANYEIKFI